MPSRLERIGTSQPRKDALAKVTGAAPFTADVQEPGLCHGVLVRSPHHHARFKVLDTAEVAGQPGVLAVLTARDVPGSPTFGALVQDQPVLAVDVVRHVGEPVALVVAEDRDAALRAAQSIQVSYDPLEAVFDPIRALQADAPLVHPGGNLLTSYDVGCGDLEAGFKLADRILEDDFSVQRVSPAYMEPETSLSRWNPDGTLTTWVSSQKPHEDRRSIAAVLSLPLERVQVLSTVVGGAFGGKEDSSIAILASLGAWATHRTVRLVNARPESFVAHPKRHPAFVHLKVGAKLDGTLTALHVAAYLDTGAYASYGPAVGGLFTEVATGPYRIPHTRVQTQVVYTNSPYSGAMRGFGSPQAHFPVESCLDMLAAQLGMDPLDLRRKNILLPGDSLPTRVVVDAGAGALGQCLDIAQEARERLRAIPAAPGRKAGVGLALALQSMGLGAQVPDVSTHRLEWLPDGRVLIYLGAPDLGQGLATVAEAIVAEALELSFDQVITAPFDTLTTPDGGVTCGSRMTYLVGNALLTGAGKLKQKLLESAAAQLDVSPDALAYQRGAVFLPDGACHPAGEFARRAWEAGSCLQAEGSAAFPYPEATTPQHLPVGMPHVKFVYAGQVARVEVDPELGTVDVTHVVAIHDVGRIIHRTALEGQIEGGIAMGIGYALLEDVALKPGAGWVDSFTEYLLPTSRDVAPELELHILEIPDPQGPYGAKGVAEICLVPTAPAIANAVQDAVDARIKHLPVTPEKILSLSRSSR